jgi:transcriptional regulator with XRE-family HTH domain
MPSRKTTPDLIKALGQVLRAERERLGWSQEVLADKAGLDRTYLSGVERGVRSPNLRSLVKITTAMKLKMSKLVLAAEARCANGE